MKSEEKHILSAYRPGTEDDQDPLMSAALDQVEKDPELRTWFSEQLAMDASIREAMLKEPAPDGLYDDLLSIGEPLRKSKIISLNRWNLGGWAAIAACFIFGLGFFFKDTLINNQVFGYHAGLSKMDRVDDFSDAMALFVSDTIINLNHFSENRVELNDWLQQANGPVFASLPSDLEALITLGCKKFYWKGDAVSLVCFHSVEGKIVHLFILDDLQIPEGEFDTLKTMQYRRGLQSKGWVDSMHQKTYMLVGSDPDVDLGGILI